jgi:hypothetical protein
MSSVLAAWEADFSCLEKGTALTFPAWKDKGFLAHCL